MSKKQSSQKLRISSGTGEPERITIEFTYPPATNPKSDAEQLFDLLADTLEHQTFNLLLERIMSYKRKCGYPVPWFTLQPNSVPYHSNDTF